MQNDFNAASSIVATGTTYSDVYIIDPEMTSLSYKVGVDSISGTGTPTVTATVQTSDNQVDWSDMYTLPDATSAGSVSGKLSNQDRYVRFKMVATGTTITASISFFAQADINEVSISDPFTLFSSQVLNATTTATSSSVSCQGFKNFRLWNTVTSAGTPTDITFTLQLSDDSGATWYDLTENFWGNLIYEDTTTASGMSEVLLGQLAGATHLRLKIDGVGTDASNTFTVSTSVTFNN